MVSPRRFSIKRDRMPILRNYLDASAEHRKRRWKSWIMSSFVILALYFMYSVNKAQFTITSLPIRSPIYIQKKYTEIVTETANNTLQIVVTEKLEDTVTKAHKVEGTDTTAVVIIENKTDETPRPAITVYCIPKKKLGRIKIIKPNRNVSIDKLYPMVQKGGYYHPSNCSPGHKVGILVPYRNRESSLRAFLYNIHPFLMNQQLEYRLFIIEQYGFKLFNKGRLLNAGFKEMLKFGSFDCIVLHDVDLLPTDDRILYSCPTLPRHMCARVRTKDLRATNISIARALFGGVTSMTVEQYKRANGYSNLYNGWGGEDNDMFFRLHAAGYPVLRYNKTIAVYSMLPHVRAPESRDRYHLLATVTERFKTDGLSNLNYVVVSTKLQHLYTHIVIDIDPSTTYKYT